MGVLGSQGLGTGGQEGVCQDLGRWAAKDVGMPKRGLLAFEREQKGNSKGQQQH